MSARFFLAFDHRGSFAREVSGAGDAGDEAAVAAVKRLVFGGLELAAERGVAGGRPCVLVDEQYGGAIPDRARARGIPVAVAVERSGQDEFQFEYGEAFGEHLERLRPDWAKVLVRYNPAGDAALNARQAERLRRLGDYLAATGRGYLFELLVPATPAQLAAAGSEEEFRRGERPWLIEAAIAELRGAGIEPDLWKLEGIETIADATRIADLCREGGRDGVSCVVLGAGAGPEQVGHWLRVAAASPGWEGFAIGRSIWRDPVRGYLAGTHSEEELRTMVADSFARFCAEYAAAAPPV